MAHQSTASIKTPELLVSVRSEREIQDARSAASDIVDLKEPRNGALAPVSIDLWRRAGELCSRCPSGGEAIGAPRLSAALGEGSDAISRAAQLPPQFQFAKAGPSRCDSPRKLRELWAGVRRRLDDPIELVAVAYADHRMAQSVSPEQVFGEAIEAGFSRCLLDTFSKQGATTLDYLGIDGLTRLSQMARQAGIWWALAGSIDLQLASRLWSYGIRPRCFAVRGDVCQQGREGRLSPQRVAAWKETMVQLRDCDLPSAQRA